MTSKLTSAKYLGTSLVGPSRKLTVIYLDSRYLGSSRERRALQDGDGSLQQLDGVLTLTRQLLRSLVDHMKKTN